MAEGWSVVQAMVSSPCEEHIAARRTGYGTVSIVGEPSRLLRSDILKLMVSRRAVLLPRASFGLYNSGVPSVPCVDGSMTPHAFIARNRRRSRS